MTKKQKRAVYYSKEKAKLFQSIKEYIDSNEFYQYDPTFKKIIEFSRDQHISFGKAIEELIEK